MKLTIIVDASTVPQKWVKPRFFKVKGVGTVISIGICVIYILKLDLRTSIDLMKHVADYTLTDEWKNREVDK